MEQMVELLEQERGKRYKMMMKKKEEDGEEVDYGDEDLLQEEKQNDGESREGMVAKQLKTAMKDDKQQKMLVVKVDKLQLPVVEEDLSRALVIISDQQKIYPHVQTVVCEVVESREDLSRDIVASDQLKLEVQMIPALQQVAPEVQIKVTRQSVRQKMMGPEICCPAQSRTESQDKGSKAECASM